MLGNTKIVMQVAAAALLLAGASDAALAKAAPKAATAGTAQLGGHPDFNGVWQVLNTADWDLEPHSAQTSAAGERVLGALAAEPAGLGVVEGGTLPYKPEAKALKDQNKANAPGHDPEAMCYLPGIPRATYIPLPFQIVQGDKGDILMVYEYASANRVIHMKPVEVPPIGAEGYSRIEPIYEELPGWKCNTFGVRRYEDLPEKARQYLKRVEEVTETEVAIISTGPDRDHTMVLHNPFE